MDSDDDFDLYTNPENNTPSPIADAPKMKRLKKLSSGFVKKSVELDEVAVDEAVSVGIGDESVDEEIDVKDLEMELTEDEVEMASEDSEGDKEDEDAMEKGLRAKRALFDDDDVDGGVEKEKLSDVDTDVEMEGDEKRKGKKTEKKRNKKKRSEGDDGEDLESGKAMSKRRSEKERREYLNQLHAESQRLLRETRDAGFKPAPVVHKPVSSVLEKIRKRKLELLKETVNHDTTFNVIEDEDEDDDLQFCEEVLNIKSESGPICGKTDPGLSVHLNEGLNNITLEADFNIKEASVNNNETTNEELSSILRSPICDTQDLFGDSETNDAKKEMSSINEDASPLEENFVPSVLAMNLRFDSALPDDDDDDDEVYSDEEDNDKENVAPRPPMHRGDPVQAFVDDEAVEEDDSDNDQLRFQENEDDDDIGEDTEDINEMIATDYEENRTDQERRQELHMKMLERQDAEGIENLLQKYNCESKLTKPKVLQDEDYTQTQDDESCDEALEAEAPKNSLRLCVKKAKQMIVHMFTDNEDAYISSEDEELETRVVNRVVRKSDDKKRMITPDQDESSREMFGMIKKLNIASEMRKKVKLSSFEMTSKSLSSSKPSFLNRTSSNSLPSSRKHGSSVTRAFVFAREDSNSRSSISVTEDSEPVQNEVQPAIRPTAKFSQSQTKQMSKDATKTVPDGASLFEMLRRSAVKPHSQDVLVGRTDSVFASFKLPKRSTKVEGKL